jgi:hypothetical protein
MLVKWLTLLLHIREVPIYSSTILALYNYICDNRMQFPISSIGPDTGYTD